MIFLRLVLSFFLSFFLVFPLLSQENDIETVCITNFNTDSDPQGMYSYATTFDSSTTINAPLVLNVKFWVLRRDDGTSANNISQNEVLEAIANLNINFNQFNIFFKYRGYEYVDNDNAYFETGMAALKNEFEVLELETDNTLNIIVHDLITVGFADSPGYFSVIPAPYLTGWVTVHETGHNLGLGHTFEKWNIPNPVVCEHVTRDDTNPCQQNPIDPYEPCFNANDKGDKVVDTAAISTTRESNNYDYSICDYTVPGEDCQGTPYDLRQEDVLNFMNVNFPNSITTCRTLFTTGQGIRMRETIVGRPDIFDFISGEVADLYEHYTGDYYIIGPTPDPHTLPLFQPGFDYVFRSCSCENQDTYDCVNGPCDFEENNFQSFLIIVNTFSKYESDYSSITHPNHASIYISQLAEYGSRRCYDNFNRAAAGGSLTQFNDGVINANVTITPQDSLQINNPNLIYNLQQGLYMIDKNFEDGSTQQTVILKENN